MNVQNYDKIYRKESNVLIKTVKLKVASAEKNYIIQAPHASTIGNDKKLNRKRNK